MAAPQKTVQLPAQVDEHTNFAELIGPVQGTLVIDGSKVERITSTGLRNWEMFSTPLKEKGVTILFRDATPALVSASALVNGLLNKNNTFSVLAPYACRSCGKETRLPFKVADLLTEMFDKFQTPCSHCGKVAEFDELPGDYFAFLGKG